jgi:hypothetical protein
MNTLPIPYISQILAGALSHNNDCGPTSALMLARAYKLCQTITVDQVFDAMQPAGDVPISAGQLQTWLAKQGIQNDWRVMTLHDLFDALYQRKPTILLIHYAPLVKAALTEKTGFTGAHFIVATGMDIESIFIHDPYRTNGTGTNQAIPISILLEAWQSATIDGNPSNCALVPRLSLCDLSGTVPATVDYTIVPKAINVRAGPSDATPILRVAWQGEVLHITNPTPTNGYVQMVGGGWVWLAYLQKV